MSIRILPDSLINQIAAGEVVERPASVVKELVENALDAGADQIIIDVTDGGRTLISVVDNGGGMTRADLSCATMRHATSKLPDDDLLNINFMGFRGEALPSIASVSDMTIDTCHVDAPHGWKLICNTGEVAPSSWEVGTRIRVENLFSRTPARLKFLRSDRAEMMSVLDVVKRLAMARADVGFTLNNKWRFPKNQDMQDRIVAIMGADVDGRMMAVSGESVSNSSLKISGFISEPTLRRASSVDQYLFVNGRPVKDKVLVGALRAAYMDVMHAREFPLCALYISLDSGSVDVNVSPAKTDVHFLEPGHVRAFIIKCLRDALARPLVDDVLGGIIGAGAGVVKELPSVSQIDFDLSRGAFALHSPQYKSFNNIGVASQSGQEDAPVAASVATDNDVAQPLGRVIGQIANKYILAQSGDNFVVVDQHAAHERIVYEQLRTKSIKVQPLLTPNVIELRDEDVVAILSVADDLRVLGVGIDSFGDGAVAVFSRPADWDFDWAELLRVIAAEVRSAGHSSYFAQRMHLKLANYACHHSVRAGQTLDYNQMDALLRDIERTSRGGECNHGRPVYKLIPITEMDKWFERI